MGYDGKLVRIYTEAAAGFSRFKYPTLIMRYLYQYYLSGKGNDVTARDGAYM